MVHLVLDVIFSGFICLHSNVVVRNFVVVSARKMIQWLNFNKFGGKEVKLIRAFIGFLHHRTDRTVVIISTVKYATPMEDTKLLITVAVIIKCALFDAWAQIRMCWQPLIHICLWEIIGCVRFWLWDKGYLLSLWLLGVVDIHIYSLLENSSHK